MSWKSKTRQVDFCTDSVLTATAYNNRVKFIVFVFHLDCRTPGILPITPPKYSPTYFTRWSQNLS